MASRSNLRSSVNNTCVKFCTRTKFGEQAFSTAGLLVHWPGTLCLLH